MIKKFKSFSKYKKLTVVYPFIHVIGFLLTVLVAKGKNDAEELFGNFLIYTVCIISLVMLIEILVRKYIYLNTFITKDFFAIAIVLLITTIVLTVSSNFQMTDWANGIEMSKRKLHCIHLYMFTSFWFATYIRVMRMVEIQDEEENNN